MMKKLLITIAFVSMAICFFGQNEWELVKNKNDIKVYTSKFSGSDYVAFKAVATINVSVDKLNEVIKDVEKYPNWLAYTAATSLLKNGSNTIIFTMETDYPWPYANECMNYTLQYSKFKNEVIKFTIVGSKENSSCKHTLKSAKGSILILPLKQKTKIVYFFHSEPSQNIAPWLINPNIHEMPYKSLMSLKRMIEN